MTNRMRVLRCAMAAICLLAVLSVAGRDFPVSDYASINAAIGACASAGGGRVVVRGENVTGPIRLKSGVELHLEEGAIVVFTDDLKDYLPGVPVSWEGVECINVSPLVYAYGCTNVAITGKGTFRPRLGFWEGWKGARKSASQEANRILKDVWAVRKVPVAERRLCDLPGAEFRPQFFHFNRCRNLRLEGFSSVGTPFWTIHLFRCQGAAVRDLNIDAFYGDGKVFNNSDGIDVESSRDVLIERCTFNQGDDAIVIKAGQNDSTVPSENVTIRDCTVRKGHVLLALGSEIGGGIRNVRCTNCRATDVANVLFVKTNPRRGGFVDGLTVENVVADSASVAVLGILSRWYYGEPGGEPLAPVEHPTSLRNISVRNVTVRTAPKRVRILGELGREVENVTVENVRVTEKPDAPDELYNVRNLTVDGVARQAPSREYKEPQW